MPKGSTAEDGRDATEGFFAELASRRHEPLLHSAVGTVRVDIHDGKTLEHYFVAMNKGEVKVSSKSGQADAVIDIDRTLFDEIAVGKLNFNAALLRGILKVEGNLGLLTLFARTFPGPPASQRSFRRRQKEASNGQ